MSVTLSDVAKRAGVSKKTASRAINNETRIAEATRQKVLAAAEELGYFPNVWAQRLARGHSGLIGMLMDNAAATYVLDVMNGLMDVGDAAGYRISLYRININDARQVDHVISMARQRRVEGFVFTPPCDIAPRLVSALQEINLPFVQLTPHDRCGDCAWVSATDERGAYDATWHLLRLGHRRIGFIGGEENHQASGARLAGFKRALREAGLEPDEQLIKPGNWRFDAGLERTRELLTLPDPPTAIIASNDETAAGVIQAAWERRIHCPGQLSVVGFDDVSLAQKLSPPLTTVKQPIYEIATTAMSILVEQIIPGIQANHAVEIPTELVIRHSTAPCSAT